MSESVSLYPPRGVSGAFFVGLVIGGSYVVWRKVRRPHKAPGPAPQPVAVVPPVAPGSELSAEDELVLAERLQGYVAATIADRLGLPDARVRTSLRKLRKAGHPV